MPNPAFMPVIGDSFGDVMRQQAGWALFNQRQDEANLARAEAADQTKNSYFNILAQMQRADADRAAQQAETAAGRQWQYGQEAERQKERGEDIATQKEQFGQSLKFQKDQLAAAAKAQEGKLSLLQQQQEMKIDHAGEIHAMQYAGLVHDRDAAQKAQDKLEEEDKAAQARIAELSAKKKLSTSESAEATRLSLQHNELQKQVKAAQRAADRTQRALDTRIAAMSAQGFTVDEENGKILHEPTGKAFDFRQAVRTARETATEANPDLGNIDLQTPAWVTAGQSMGMDQEPAPAQISFAQPDAQSAPAPIKIGRFSVTPR